MTGLLTKKEAENWTLEDDFMFWFKMKLTSHDYFAKRSPENFKSLDKEIRELLAEYYKHKSKSALGGTKE